MSPFVFHSAVATNVPKRLIDQYKLPEQSDWNPQQASTANRPYLYGVISTGSGIGLAAAVWDQLVKPLLDCSGLIEQNGYAVHSTTSETSAAELTRDVILLEANRGLPQSILLLSGDGGMVDIINTLLSSHRSEMYTKPKISLLPLGTGNALANSAGITNDNTMGLQTALLGSAKEVPIFRAMFSLGARLLVNEGCEERRLQDVADGKPVAHGAVVCSWGHHAALVADSDTTEYRKFGAERFKMAAKEALFPSDGSPPHAYKGRVSILRPGKHDWEPIPGDKHGYVLATLVSQLEAGFIISPSSKPLDGKLRLVHFGDLSGQEAMDIMGKAFKGGKHVDDNKVGYEVIEGMRIEFDEDEARWRRVCVDGKIIAVEKGGWVDVTLCAQGVVDLVSKDF